MQYVLSLLIAAMVATASCAGDAAAQLKLHVAGEDGKPLPCRVHVRDAAGKPLQAPGLPFWRDHFVCSGEVTLSLPPGKYRYEIERGPEWRPLTGQVDLGPGASQLLNLQLKRLTNLAAGGWFCGDVHVHRPLNDIELLMRAEDLHIAPVITWWNTRNEWANRVRPAKLLHRFDGNRFYHVMAGEDERGGGALLYFHLNEPLAISKASREHPASIEFAEQSRKVNDRVWIDIEKPFWWDLPLWLALGQMDSIGVANNHMCRSSVYPGEAWGRPRDERRLPAPLGNGRWTQEIYYHLLNCGLRLPPSAGSASGVLPNPVGYNRVYVHVDGELTYEDWWRNLKSGRCFVTNGPLLLCTVDGKLPGEVFRVHGRDSVRLNLNIELMSSDPVKNIEVIVNGNIVETIPVLQSERFRKSIALDMKRSGWLLVRAIADVPTTFRFGSTGPFYVELGDSPRHVSLASVKFFQQWVAERVQKLETALPPGEERRAVLEHWQTTRRFWHELAKQANGE